MGGEMMITVAPELKASLRVARAVLASRARPWAGRSALVVTLLVSAAPGVVARHQAGTSQASEEVALVSTGWSYLAAGDLARAIDHANLALAKSPRSLAAITLLVHADIMRAGASTGLDSYEQWLGGRAPDDGYLLRHLARALLLEIRRSADLPSRVQALKHLSKDGDADARAELTRQAYKGGITELRCLAELGDAGAVRQLIGMLKQSSKKLEIIDALVASGHALAIPPLLDLLADADRTIVAAAADGLGKLGAQEAVARLKPLLTSPASTRLVKLKAAEALFRLGDDTGAELLANLLKSPEAALRIVGATAMASRPNPAWLAAVRDLLEASHPVVRLEAAALIAQYEPEAARATLDRLLADGTPPVRIQAARVLAERVAGDFATLRKLMKAGDTLARVRAAGRILELTQ
jgi:HEAT repeat protein